LTLTIRRALHHAVDPSVLRQALVVAVVLADARGVWYEKIIRIKKEKYVRRRLQIAENFSSNITERHFITLQQSHRLKQKLSQNKHH
jgi:hypothetical protein